MHESAIQSPVTIRVYKYMSYRGWSPWLTLTCLVYWVGFYGYWISNAFQRGDRVGAIAPSVLIVLSVLSALIGWLGERNTYLEVLPTGLRLHWRGQNLYASWSEIGWIAKIKQPCYVDWEGITLRVAHREGRWWSALLVGFWPMPRFIPLWSGKPLWDRELGNDLRYYAPWVFDDAPVSSAPNDMPQRGYYRAEAFRAR